MEIKKGQWKGEGSRAKGIYTERERSRSCAPVPPSTSPPIAGRSPSPRRTSITSKHSCRPTSKATRTLLHVPDSAEHTDDSKRPFQSPSAAKRRSGSSLKGENAPATAARRLAEKRTVSPSSHLRGRSSDRPSVHRAALRRAKARNGICPSTVDVTTGAVPHLPRQARAGRLFGIQGRDGSTGHPRFGRVGCGRARGRDPCTDAGGLTWGRRRSAPPAREPCPATTCGQPRSRARREAAWATREQAFVIRNGRRCFCPRVLDSRRAGCPEMKEGSLRAKGRRSRGDARGRA